MKGSLLAKCKMYIVKVHLHCRLKISCSGCCTCELQTKFTEFLSVFDLKLNYVIINGQEQTLLIRTEAMK